MDFLNFSSPEQDRMLEMFLSPQPSPDSLHPLYGTLTTTLPPIGCRNSWGREE